MAKGNTHDEDAIRAKMLAYKIKATTYLKGADKNKFMIDCLKRGTYEGALLRDIVNTHYAIIEQIPAFKDKEMTDLKKYLIDKIKL
jgi:hypothetical protein